LHIYHFISQLFVNYCRIPPWSWQKNSETHKRLAVLLYTFVSNYRAVDRIDTLKSNRLHVLIFRRSGTEAARTANGQEPLIWETSPHNFDNLLNKRHLLYWCWHYTVNKAILDIIVTFHITIFYVTSLLVTGELGRLGTRISVVCVKTSHRKDLAAWCSKEYPLVLMYSLYAANGTHWSWCTVCMQQSVPTGPDVQSVCSIEYPLVLMNSLYAANNTHWSWCTVCMQQRVTTGPDVQSVCS
jgi:hypothetical protein